MSINNNNTANKHSVTSRFREALGRFVMGKNHPSHMPHIPQPGQTLPDPLAGLSDDFSETKINIQHIGDTGIAFGRVEGIRLDDEGNGQEIIKQLSHRIGTGSLVSDIAQVAGICSICELVSLDKYQAGLITLQEANLRAMYDHQSAAECDICGRHFCSAHCRPVKINDDVLRLCVVCLKTAQKKQRHQKFLSWLLAPLTESTKQEEEGQR